MCFRDTGCATCQQNQNGFLMKREKDKTYMVLLQEQEGQ